ncbi:MAG: class I SAM-dependent methyltransferase [Actinobacteria bacterium]|nr:MAG: class I SAM-dependent methyltransferase [Actinomycetota bacterium]
MAGQLGIPDGIRELLPEVAGKHVLHLQCATGESTAELVALGALVSAVDISTEALEVARERAPDVAYVHADAHDLPLELRRARFDLVYTGGGVLHWLHDLDSWAVGIAAALKPGGLLLLYDNHPLSECVDPLGHWREDYFDDALQVTSGWEHFELTGPAATEQKHERHWQLGQIVDAITGAGLGVTRLVEFQTLYNWLQRDRRVPWEFALLARKPE